MKLGVHTVFFEVLAVSSSNHNNGTTKKVGFFRNLLMTCGIDNTVIVDIFELS